MPKCVQTPWVGSGANGRQEANGGDILTESLPGKLPKVIWLGGALEVGRPPVADGMGIGEGDCAGEGIRWLLVFPGMGIGAETEG